MAGQVAHKNEREDTNTLIQHLHRLVIHGPWDLEIAYALSRYGYDAVKWAEGETVLAELLSCDRPRQGHLACAVQWYEEAAKAARRALGNQPQLLEKLGVLEIKPASS
jgi:hypothetical protein